MKSWRISVCFIVVFLTIAIAAVSQSRQYFDDEWNETTKSNASYYRITKPKGNLFIVRDFYMNGALQFETTSTVSTEPFNKQGYTAWYDKDGDTVDFAIFKNDTLNGALVGFYKNGKRREVQHFKMSKKHGFFAQYYPWGEVKQYFGMSNNRAHGKGATFNLRGMPMQVGYWDNGIEVGGYTIYHDNGNIRHEANLNMNRDSGSVVRYYENGQLWERYNISNSYLDGSFVSCHQNGDTNIKALFDGRGLLSFHHVYHANGSEFVKKMERIKDKEQWKIYRDDVIIMEGGFVANDFSGDQQVWTMYTLDGKKIYGTIQVDCSEEEFEITQYKPESVLEDLAGLCRIPSSLQISMSGCPQKETIHLKDEKHPFYYDKRIKKENNNSKTALRIFEMNESKLEDLSNEKEGSDSFDYIDPTLREDFMAKNPGTAVDFYGKQYFTFEKTYGNIKIIFYKAMKKEVLLKVKESITPKENEIHFFYRQIPNGRYSHMARLQKRFVDFKLNINLIQILDFDSKLEIIDLIENDIFSTSDFAGTLAYSALDKYCDKEIEKTKKE